MLRVSSILYLQQVWSRPACPTPIPTVDIVKPTPPVIEVPEEAQEHPEVSTDVYQVSIQEQEPQEPQGPEEPQEPEQDVEHVSIAASRTVSFQEASICSSLHMSSPSMDATRSEIVVNIQQPLPKAIEREFYDDDIDLDDEDDEEINTPPSTPSSKFSPKRILHRAKSSINDESVRNLGRRTSMFLEKFNYQPSLPATTNLRRQSSKLTNKGKTLSKKLKRVLSFHQSK